MKFKKKKKSFQFEFATRGYTIVVNCRVPLAMKNTHQNKAYQLRGIVKGALYR